MSRRVIDCTKVLRHGAENGFTALEFERDGQPQTLVHRIEMDADVGTHVLAPRRYIRWGADLAGLPPETFFGEGLVANLDVTPDAPDIDSNRLEDAFGRNLRNRDIVVIAARGEGVVPSFTAQAAQWLFIRGAKLVALADGISIGREQEPDDERVILSTLLENEVPVVRGLVNTEQLSSERIAFMAIPAAATDVTAWPVRVIALDPGLDPTQEAVTENGAVAEPEPATESEDAEPTTEAIPADSDPDEPSSESTVDDEATDDAADEAAPEPGADDEASPEPEDPDESDATRRGAEA
jgi:kynurenine formamidase